MLLQQDMAAQGMMQSGAQRPMIDDAWILLCRPLQGRPGVDYPIELT